MDGALARGSCRGAAHAGLDTSRWPPRGRLSQRHPPDAGSCRSRARSPPHCSAIVARGLDRSHWRPSGVDEPGQALSDDPGRVRGPPLMRRLVQLHGRPCSVIGSGSLPTFERGRSCFGWRKDSVLRHLLWCSEDSDKEPVGLLRAGSLLEHPESSYVDACVGGEKDIRAADSRRARPESSSSG